MEKGFRSKREKRLWLAALVFLALGGVLRVISGMRFSARLFFCGAAVLALLALLERGTARGSRPAHWARNALLVLLALGFAFFAVLEAQVLRGAPPKEADAPVSAVIVLGAGVNGETPSLTLRTRIDAAADYLRAHPDLPAILSGGQGEGEDITEAECMRRALVSRSIEESRLYLEERSTSTRENFAYSKEILASLLPGGSVDSVCVAVVTSDFHLFRASLFAQPELCIIGVPAHFPPALYYRALTVNYYVREAFALASFYVFGG